MLTIPKAMKLAILAAGLNTFATVGHASLVLLGPENFQGTGLGAVNTILTIQSPRNSTSETGSVSFNGTSDVRTGDTQNGASQTLTRSIGDLGLTSASSLRVVFNALEPGNAANNITLNNLVLNIFGTNGATLFTSGAFTPVAFPDTQTGAGNSGFVFGLDAAQAAQAQALGFGSASNRIGLLASASDATGGFETFFVANSSRVTPPTDVPEPMSLALFGAGLLGLGLVRQSRRAAA